MPGDLSTLTAVSDLPHLLAGDLIVVACILMAFVLFVGVLFGLPLHFAYLVGYDHGATAERKDHRATQQAQKVRDLQQEVRDLKSDGRSQSIRKRDVALALARQESREA